MPIFHRPPAADVLPIFAANRVPVIINWGLGLDSTTFLARMLEDPARHGIDLDSCVVITMMTGSEWPDTIADAERFILPLLCRHRVRYVQLARTGQPKSAGITVLDDSRSPHRLFPVGPWRLWDELESNGTVPQVAGRRLCSIRAKGEVGDRWIASEYPGQPFVQIIGFNADEAKRIERDQTTTLGNSLRTARFPLIDPKLIG